MGIYDIILYRDTQMEMMSVKKHFNLGNDAKSSLATRNLENNYDFDDTTYVYDESIKNDGHMAVIRQIKEGSEVLDIGCASGILGATISKYKNCIVDGIEYDKEAVKIASKKNSYRDVFNFSISDTTDEKYKKFVKLNRKYDFIVFADVLEHLVNPWNALVNASLMLKKNGKIVISLPNIAHLDIIKALINHEFNYTRYGILDQTHLRFFTSSSFLDMIKNIADEYNVYFNVEKVENVLIKPDYFVNDKDYSLFNMNSDLEDYLALQNIFVLTLTSSKKNMSSNIDNVDKNNFDKMMDNYNKLVNNCDELKKQNDENNLKITCLQSEVNRLEKELDDILKSKRWKMLNKIFKIIGK